MDESANTDFGTQLKDAINTKSLWYDSELLPKLSEDYRLHLTALRVLIDELTKKSLITPDPYKKDKKISEVNCPDDSDFNDSERSVKLGTRISEYETTLDFICNYMKFSCENLTMDKIKKLLMFNNVFNWENLSMNSQRANSRALAYCVNQLKASANPILLSNLSDAMYKTTQALKEINNGLKELANFQKERYKLDVRTNVIEYSGFSKSSFCNTTAFIAEIKKHWTSRMPKRNFASELISEIAAEETSPNKEDFRAKLLKDLSIPEKKVVKKAPVIDTHENLMDAIRTLGSLCNQYEMVLQKIKDNHSVLESEHQSFFDKIAAFFRNLFGRKDPTEDYELVIVDKQSNAKKIETLNYNTFYDSLEKRTTYYSSIAIKNSPGYSKINMQKDPAILDFLHKQIADNSRLHTILTALDEFFKTQTNTKDRARIRGIKMELTTIKNILIKTNQLCAEYTAYIDEQKQMEKLGINE